MLVLFEATCQLLQLLKPLWTTISSSEGISAFNRGPDAAPQHPCDMQAVNPIPVSDVLADNLRRRLEELGESLDFIAGSASMPMDREAALAAAHAYTTQLIRDEPRYGTRPPDLEVPITIAKISSIFEAIPTVKSAANPLQAFAEYADPDIELERIEFLVDELAKAVDYQIQLEADIARGKYSDITHLIGNDMARPADRRLNVSVRPPRRRAGYETGVRLAL